MCAFVFLFKIYFCFLIVCACKWVCAPLFWAPMFPRLLQTQSKHEQNSKQRLGTTIDCLLSSPFSSLPTPISLRLLAFDTQAGNRFICLFFWRSVFRATGSRRVYSGVGRQAEWVRSPEGNQQGLEWVRYRCGEGTCCPSSAPALPC